jgi:hypothetical protein
MSKSNTISIEKSVFPGVRGFTASSYIAGVGNLQHDVPGVTHRTIINGTLSELKYSKDGLKK